MEKRERYPINEKMAMFRLENCRKSLKQRYPDFTFSLSGLKFKKRGASDGCPYVREKALSTDGLTVFFSPDQVLKQRTAELETQMMHIVLHGLLGHFLHQQDYVKHDYRDPLMDVQVAYLLQELGLGNHKIKDAVYKAEQLLHGDFSMKQYYRALREQKVGTNLYRITWDVAMDDHREWDYRIKMKRLEDLVNDTLIRHQEEIRHFWENARRYFLDDKDAKENDYVKVKTQVLKYCQMSLKPYGSTAGNETGLFSVGRKKGRNYRELLRDVFAVREVTKEQPDSIDMMFYHYGLELNENAPLIEPLEYGEVRTSGLIVIAVDTSGSCVSNEVMEKFWNETYECISQLKTDSGEGEILILQCDTKIQKEERFSLAEFEKAPERVRVLGWGGTSFVPVFDRIEELLQEDNRVEALLYLTDGVGEYPERKPEVPVYFIMLPEECDSLVHRNAVPEWIELVRMEET